MKKIELLAPAKNLENGIIAIKSGADAVYIGASKFGARSKAGNSVEDIQSLVNFAHQYDAKVYVTVNTILNDAELIDAKKLIQKLHEIKVDALIIQDFGLLEMDLPPIPIFASTQMNNDTLEKIQFLEAKGFSRIILPRELSLDEIKNISENTHINLESFCHGSLCVSYSGQCYLSQLLGGRSSNRGQCAQPCRKKYTLVDADGKVIAKDKHLLSLKDLNLSNNLEELIDNGITSFKIEGRSKDANYIKNVVSFYREKLDIAIENSGNQKASLGSVYKEFTPDLNKTFNRSFTKFNLKGQCQDIAAVNSPKNVGESMGQVVGVEGINVYLKASHKMANGDGVTLFKNGELVGTTVNNAYEDYIQPNNPNMFCKGDFVYRNYDKKFNDLLEKSKLERKISVSIYVNISDDEMVLSITDEVGVTEQLSIKNNFEEATNKAKAIDNIKKQLSKLGETIYEAESVNVEMINVPFIPVSELNLIRRNLIQKFNQTRKKAYKNQKSTISKKIIAYPVEKLDYTANVYNQKAKEFYEKHNSTVTELAAETGGDLRYKVLLTSKHCLRHHFNICKKTNPNADFREPFYLVDEKNYKYKLHFDCKMCKMSVLNAI